MALCEEGLEFSWAETEDVEDLEFSLFSDSSECLMMYQGGYGMNSIQRLKFRALSFEFRRLKLQARMLSADVLDHPLFSIRALPEKHLCHGFSSCNFAK